jgi:hypothetical protein
LVFQPEVGWLDVAVNQAALVGCGQTACDLPPQAKNLSHAEERRGISGLCSPEVFFQAHAFEQLHGHVGYAGFFAHLEDGDDIFVFKRRRGLSLPQKSFVGAALGGGFGA